MSKLTEFIAKVTSVIYTNGQKLITAQQVQDVFNIDLAPNIKWVDQDEAYGFSGKWILLDGVSGVPSSEGMTSDDLAYPDITTLKIHKDSIGVSFNDTINKVGGISLTNASGEKFIFEVASGGIDVKTSYVVFDGLAKLGTLTTLVVGEEYTLGFIYGAEDVEVTSIYVTSEAEFLAAATNINTNYVGGNIILGDNLTMTQDWTLDLTNIDIYGFNHVLSNGANDIGSDLGYKLTVGTGSPAFNNMHFAGSESRSQSIQMSGQNSRELFDFGSVAGTRKITFNDCLFNDIVGGIGTNEVMRALSVSSGGRLEVVFNRCTTNSHNNSVEFNYNGMIVNCDTVTGRFLVNVYAQKPDISETSLSDSSLGFQVVSSSGDAPVFNSDGSAYLVTGSNATDEKYLNLEGVPTSDPLSVGVVWNNAGILTISAG